MLLRKRELREVLASIQTHTHTSKQAWNHGICCNNVFLHSHWQRGLKTWVSPWESLYFRYRALCLCVCITLTWMYAHVYMHVKTGDQCHRSSSIGSHFTFETKSHLSIATVAGSELWDTPVADHKCWWVPRLALMGVVGIWVQVLMFSQKALFWLSHVLNHHKLVLIPELTWYEYKHSLEFV